MASQPLLNATLSVPASAASCISPGAVLESGGSGARYTAERCIGAGSFGQVWLCREAGSGGMRAVKLLPCEGADAMAKEVAQSKRATEAAGEHCVPKFYEASEAGIVGRPEARLLLIAMEFIDGTNAGQLSEAGALPETCTRTILGDIAIALGRLHHCGVIHRDVKGDNVIVSKAGNSYLCDFGLSACPQELTAEPGDKRREGTPYYMAPELMADPPVYSEKSDVWALGITAIQLAAGTIPLHSERFQDVDDILDYIAMNPSPEVPVGLGYSFVFVESVQACLERNLVHRPSVRQLLRGRAIRPQGPKGYMSVQRWLARGGKAGA